MLKRNDEPDASFDESDEPIVSPASKHAAKPASKLATIFSGAIRGIFQIILMVAVLAGSFMAMNKLIASKPEIRKRPSFRTVYAVNTKAVRLSDHRPEFTVYGQSVASRTVDLRSLVSGEVIDVNPKLKIGEKIDEGDWLIKIDKFNYQGSLREAKANRDEADARILESNSRILLEKSKFKRLSEQLNLTKKDHARIAKLRKQGTTTQKQLDDRTMALSQRAQAAEQSKINLTAENARLQQQKASLQKLEWRVQLAQKQLDSTVLKAPFDGVVRTSNVEKGKTVGANDVVVSLYEDKKIDVKFTLSDERYGRLQTEGKGLLGRKIKVIWTIGGQKYFYPALIDRIGADISPNRGGVEVFATLQQVAGNPALRPGAFVEIRVPDVNFANSASVPETAVYDGNRIYLKVGDHLVSKPVTVLAFSDGNVIISADLKPDDRVLITRIAEISDGLKVREAGQNQPGTDAKHPKMRAKKPDGKS